ncbi:Pyruvate dehydrogenase phosphatase regulatory subunit, mitochondrial, partial [Eufriesea mexicana]
PCIRDYDSYSYMREWQGGLLIGWFEPESRPAFENGIVPIKNWKNHLTVDTLHWKPLWDKIIHRLPLLKNIQPSVYNCPDNFTPDGRWILGESPEVKNYFVAVGMNGNSLQGAGGIGKEVAECLINGESTQELLPFSVQRFLKLHSSKQYLQQRTKEIVGRNYAILYPHQCEYKYARKLRCSPLYSVLEERGAIFGVKMAYERPLYFNSTYRKVVQYLQQLCSNDANIPVGSIVHTGMQNERGGYENDCILVRQTENSYFMVSPTSQQTRIYQWMSRHLPPDHLVGLNDVTSKYTVINLVGPKATGLLSELSNSDINLSPFTYKNVNVAYASDVMVMSFTHTGESGYCLYIPSEYALHVYSRLMEVGKDYGIRDVGVLTQRFMRIERFIPFWAEELTPFVTPYEAGSGYSVKLDKEYFIGKFALQRQKEQGVSKRLVLFVVNELDINKDVWPWGGEPVYRNNEFVGTVTSAGYGFAAEKHICLGFISLPKSRYIQTNPNIVTTDFIMEPKAHYEIDIAGTRFPIKPHIRPLPIP